MIKENNSSSEINHNNQSIDGNNNTQVGGNLTLNIQTIYRLPSLLADVVPILNNLIAQGKFDAYNTLSNSPYSIEDKINHNHLVAYRHWIEEYGQWGYAVDAAYDELDDLSPGAKVKIFRHFVALYSKLKGEIFTLFVKQLSRNELSQLEVIRKNADEIINKTAQSIRDELSQHGNTDLTAQDLLPVSIILTCHAFISCKILERPPHNAS